MSSYIENCGINDETLNNFREFMEMATVVGTSVDFQSEDDFLTLGGATRSVVPVGSAQNVERSQHQCPVCLDLLYRPHSLDPCRHIFCETCLRRLSQAQIVKCPICRAIIRKCYFNEGNYVLCPAMKNG